MSSLAQYAEIAVDDGAPDAPSPELETYVSALFEGKGAVYKRFYRSISERPDVAEMLFYLHHTLATIYASGYPPGQRSWERLDYQLCATQALWGLLHGGQVVNDNYPFPLTTTILPHSTSKRTSEAPCPRSSTEAAVSPPRIRTSFLSLGSSLRPIIGGGPGVSAGVAAIRFPPISRVILSLGSAQIESSCEVFWHEA